ncbi:MAG TPA: cation:dicarboxylase symporter family transporter, partial [Terriglobales bacterium]|nr:cation:dicarboxylase symporter family transporter [Terriglobales bacterium]
MKRLQLHWQILAAILLAVFTGAIVDSESTVAGLPVVASLEFVGGLFLRGLQMLVVPLIASSIISSVANSRSQRDLGQLGARTIGYYLTTSTLAILVGLVVVNLFSPGIVDGRPAGDRLGLGVVSAEALAKIEGHGWSDMLLTLQRLVPANVIASASQNEMLGVISFSLMFGYFVAQIRADYSELMIKFWEAIAETMMHITLFVM